MFGTRSTVPNLLFLNQWQMGDYDCLTCGCTLGRHHRGICNATVRGKRRRAPTGAGYDPKRHALLPSEGEQSRPRPDALDDGSRDTVVRYTIEQVPEAVIARFARWPHSRVSSALECVTRDESGFVVRGAEGGLVGRARHTAVAVLMALATQAMSPRAVVPWIHMMVNDS